MTWVHFRKYFYLPLLVSLAGGAVMLSLGLGEPGSQLVALLLVAVILFLPSAIGRSLLRDLFASRALMARQDYPGALDAARRFLRQLGQRPWIKHAIWTQFGIYSLEVEAMALNNAGAALLEQKRYDEARGVLHRARDIDPRYPIPVVNLAVIAKLTGDNDGSERLAREAAELGFARGKLDGILNAIGATYARLTAPSR